MEKTQVVLCFSVSRNQIPDYNPKEENLTEKILDHVGDFKNLEEVMLKLTGNLNLNDSQVESLRNTLIKAEEEAANKPSSKSKTKKMKKQASMQQTQPQLLDSADVETIQAMKKEISTTVDLLKILQHLHKVLFPTRVGAGNQISGQVRASAGNKISGQVRDGNKISGQVRAGNINSEQARLRKHDGNRWE